MKTIFMQKVALVFKSGFGDWVFPKEKVTNFFMICLRLITQFLKKEWGKYLVIRREESTNSSCEMIYAQK